MGKNFDHVIMKVEITQKPSDDATVKLLATERTRQETDLIKDGWGGPDGYELGGKDATQILDIRGVFSKAGAYGIKIALLDKDNSDALIVEKEFNLNVEEKQTSGGDNNTGNTNNGTSGENTENNEQTGNNNQSGENQITENQKPNNEVSQNEKEPETLPKTGMTKYVYIITILAILGTSYLAINNIKKKD